MREITAQFPLVFGSGDSEEQGDPMEAADEAPVGYLQVYSTEIMIDCLIQLTKLNLHEIMKMSLYEALHWYSYAVAKSQHEQDEYKKTQAKLQHR